MSGDLELAASGESHHHAKSIGESRRGRLRRWDLIGIRLVLLTLWLAPFSLIFGCVALTTYAQWAINQLFSHPEIVTLHSISSRGFVCDDAASMEYLHHKLAGTVPSLTFGSSSSVASRINMQITVSTSTVWGLKVTFDKYGFPCNIWPEGDQVLMGIDDGKHGEDLMSWYSLTIDEEAPEPLKSFFVDAANSVWNRNLSRRPSEVWPGEAPKVTSFDLSPPLKIVEGELPRPMPEGPNAGRPSVPPSWTLALLDSLSKWKGELDSNSVLIERSDRKTSWEWFVHLWPVWAGVGGLVVLGIGVAYWDDFGGKRMRRLAFCGRSTQLYAITLEPDSGQTQVTLRDPIALRWVCDQMSNARSRWPIWDKPFRQMPITYWLTNPLTGGFCPPHYVDVAYILDEGAELQLGVKRHRHQLDTLNFFAIDTTSPAAPASLANFAKDAWTAADQNAT